MELEAIKTEGGWGEGGGGREQRGGGRGCGRRVGIASAYV